MDATTLFVGGILGAIGLAYIVYGKKQRKAIALLCGVGLCGIPYFISNMIALVAVCVALMVLPFFARY